MDGNREGEGVEEDFHSIAEYWDVYIYYCINDHKWCRFVTLVMDSRTKDEYFKKDMLKKCSQNIALTKMLINMKVWLCQGKMQINKQN